MNADIPVINILAGNADVGLYIGGSGMGVARVFTGDVPQGKPFPHICVDVFDSEPFDTKSGPSVIDHEMVKVFCYANTVRDVIRLSVRARQALDGTTGTYAGEMVRDIRYLRTDSYNIPLTNKKVYVREHDYLVRLNVSNEGIFDETFDETFE